jgi:glycosyltransferase involved in cell wall biosynthesis
MIAKSNTLLLFTQAYPFGKEETFLEEEIEILKNNFEKIYILSSSNAIITREIPSNTKAIKIQYINLNFRKIYSVLFNKNYWLELIVVMKKNPLKVFSFGLQKTLIYSLANSLSLADKVDDFVKENIDSSTTNLFFYSYWINDFTLSFIHLKEKIKGKYFSRGHGWDVYLERSAFNYLPLRSLLPQYLDSIYFISESGCNYYKDIFFDSNNLRTSKLGVSNLIPYKNIIPKQRITIVSCSLIVPVKRIDLIAKSLSLLNNIDYIWYHIGYDTCEGKLNKQINELAKDLNVNLKMVGFLSNKEIHKFYLNNQIDLFINLSSSEGIPVSIMEAFSHSIPVIATNVGGTSEIVTNQNGYLVEANSTAKEVSKIIKFFYALSLEEKNSKRKIAYKTWQEKYNSKTNYTQFVEDILSL